MKQTPSAPTLLALAMLCLTLAGCGGERHSAEAAKPYPLDTCIVSDEKLGADPGMVPYLFVHQGQEIKLCCKSCLKSFNAEPEKYLAKLEQPAAPAQAE